MWFTLMSSIFALSAVGIQGGMQVKAGKEAREEASRLAMQKRADVLGQRKREERFAREDLALGEERLEHSRKQAEQQDVLRREQAAFDIQQEKRKTITQSAQKLLNKPADSFLFRKRNVERFSI